MRTTISQLKTWVHAGVRVDRACTHESKGEGGNDGAKGRPSTRIVSRSATSLMPQSLFTHLVLTMGSTGLPPTNKTSPKKMFCAAHIPNTHPPDRARMCGTRAKTQKQCAQTHRRTDTHDLDTILERTFCCWQSELSLRGWCSEIRTFLGAMQCWECRVHQGRRGWGERVPQSGHTVFVMYGCWK